MKISAIIPTLNEESSLFSLLATLRSAGRPEEIEIIVVDGGSSDHTLEVAREFADQALKADCRGRARQMHQGALAASGDVLFFLHADTRLPVGWQETFREAWKREDRPAATAFRLRFDGSRIFYRLLEAAANFRTHWTGVPHGDQAIAVARDVYFAVGGFPPVPLMEEYYLFHELRCRGSLRVLPQAVMTSTRRYEKNGPLRNALRNIYLVALHYLGVRPEALARMYR